MRCLRNYTNDEIYSYNSNKQNYDEYSLNQMINNGYFIDSNVIQDNEIYNERDVYCPICKFKNEILFNKNYDGVVQKES